MHGIDDVALGRSLRRSRTALRDGWSYRQTAVGYPPTVVGYPPTAVGYPPTAVGHPPTVELGGGRQQMFSLFLRDCPVLSCVEVVSRDHYSGVWRGGGNKSQCNGHCPELAAP